MIATDERFDAWKRRPTRPALAALLEATQERVYRICLQVLRHRQDAEEAKQEVLLEIASGLGGVADAAHFGRWVGVVAFRTALDRRRMRLRRSSRELRAAGRSLDGNGADDTLHEAMSRLDEEDRVLLIERYFDRRTLGELAESRGISAVGVRKRLEKAQERLKRMLGGAFLFVPGGAFSGIAPGQAFGAGIAAMKLKTLANAVTIAMLLLMVTIGAWVVLIPAASETGPSDKSRPARRRGNPPPELSQAHTPKPTVSARKEEAVAVSKVEPGRLGRASRMLQLVEQISFSSKQIRKLLNESRESLSEMDGRQLQRLAKELQDGLPGLYRELKELVGDDPAAVQVSLESGLRYRVNDSLVPLIKGAVESEIVSEDSPPGPLLSGLLHLARGDNEDKELLLAISRGLTRANRSLGEASLRLITDADARIRAMAAFTLADHARRGILKDYLQQNAASIRQASTSTEEADLQVRGLALIALAAVGTADNDDFVLQRFEVCDSSLESNLTGEAILHVAPRIAARSEARLHASLLRAMELPFNHRLDEAMLDLSLYLPDRKCLEVLRIAESRRTAEQGMAYASVKGWIWHVEAGRREELRDAREKSRLAVFACRHASPWPSHSHPGLACEPAPGVQR